MILKKTVFVLGAGASNAYGLPLGSDLASFILTSLRSGDASPIWKAAIHNGVDEHTISDFSRRFSESASWSVDTFSASDPSFALFSKIATVCEVGIREQEARLTPPGGVPDWYGYLFHNMLPAGGADYFGRNQLRIVTFNFDRSFESRLWRVLRANYGETTARELAGTVRILHVHGSLGAPQWLTPDDPHARPYEPLVLDDLEGIGRIARGLRLVQDEVEKTVGSELDEWLSWAEQICFIGLHYHPLNLERLTIDDPDAVQIKGTRFGMDDGEVRHLTRHLKGIELTPKDVDALGFLKHTGVANEWVPHLTRTRYRPDGFQRG